MCAMFNSPFQNNYGVNYGMPNYGQPTYQPNPQMYRPQQAQPQPQQPYEMPLQDVRFVTSEEAKAFILMPNTKVLLIDRNSGIAHLKVADNLGQSNTMLFRFEPINPDGTPIQATEPTPQVDMSQYVTKQDLGQYGFVTGQDIKDLTEKVDTIQRFLGSLS
jgi:hypothetical protein